MIQELLIVVKADQYTLPKSKVKTVKNDTDTPKKKRPPTGYLVFSNANRDNVKQDLIVDDYSVNPKIDPKDITREVARRWKLLSDHERNKWNSKAKYHIDPDSID